MASADRRRILEVKVTDTEKRRFPSKHYVYIINISWNDGTDTVIYRRYSKFFDFQITLLEMYPKEGGMKDPALRIIPFLPGKILFRRSHVRDVAIKRLRPIDEYCQALIKLPAYISENDHVLDFFETKPDDMNPYRDDSILSKKQRKDDSVKRRSLSLRRSVRRTCSFDVNEISGPIILEQYTAVADYNSTQSKELDIYAGQIIEVIEKHENGWWFISNDEGERGWVPGVYLEKSDGSTEDLVIKQLEPGQGETYITTHAYTAENPDEVSFQGGVMVEVLQKNLEGWWKIIFNGKQGFAPASYLEKSHNWSSEMQSASVRVSNNIDNKPRQNKHRLSLPSSNSLSCISHPTLIDTTSSLVQANDLQPVKPDNSKTDNTEITTAASVHNIKHAFERKSNNQQVQAPPKRRSTLKRTKKPAGPPPLPPTPMSSPQSEYEYMTVADFQANIPDGISFQSGSRIKVIEKSPGGWWFINNSGSEGWAPATYIEKKLKATHIPPPRPSIPPKDTNNKPPLKETNSAGNLFRNDSPLRRVIMGEEKKQLDRAQSVISPATRPLPPLPKEDKANQPKHINKTEAVSTKNLEDDPELESLRPPPLPPTNKFNKLALQHSMSSPTLPSKTENSDSGGAVDFRSVLKTSISKRIEQKEPPASAVKGPAATTNTKAAIRPPPLKSKYMSNSAKTTTTIRKTQPAVPVKPKTVKPAVENQANENQRPSFAKPSLKTKDDSGVVDFRSVLNSSVRNIKNSTPVNRSRSFNNQTTTKPVMSVKTNGNSKPPKLPQKPPTMRKPVNISSNNSSPKTSPIHKAKSTKPSLALDKKPVAKLPAAGNQNQKPVLKRFQNNNNNGGNDSSANKPVIVVGRLQVEANTPDLSSTFPVRGSPDGEVCERKFTESKAREDKQTILNKRLSNCSSTYSNDDSNTKLLAIMDYNGIEECEISFGKGEEAVLLDKAPNNWWYVRIHDVSGWAPSTYFESQGSADSGFHNDSKRNSTAESTSENSSDAEQAAIHQRAIQEIDSIYSVIEESMNKTKNSVTIYKAASNFTASDSSMMSFSEGDKMTVGEHSDGGWCFATLLDGTAEGWIPFTFIEPDP